MLSSQPQNTSAISENRMSPEKKWKLLFSTFLNTPVDSLNLEVNVDNAVILLTTTDRAIAEQLIKVLNSPERLRASLNYTLTEQSNTSQTVTTQIISHPPAIKLQHGIGEIVYEQLFGKATLRRLGYIDWKSEVPREDCFVLQGSCNPEYQGFDEPQIAKCKEFLSSATFDELRKALSSDPSQYKFLPNRLSKDGVLAKHIDKILYRSNDGTSVFLDYGLLINCINAPDMEILNAALEEKTQQQFQIRINKTHLINYFSVIFKEGFVLNVSGDNDSPTQQATPILFSIKRSMPLKNIVTLILDCSSSMESARSQYLLHVKNFIYKLSTEEDYQDAEIRVTQFSNRHFTRTFKMTEKNWALNYIDSLSMEGGTELNATMNAELSNLLKNARNNENHTVITFTDGEDTGSVVEATNLKYTTSRISQKQGNRPKIFAMGLGSCYDETKLRQLADLTGGAFIKLATINDFRAILEHLEQMGHVKEFMTFIQKEVTTFVTPSYVNDLSVSSNSLTIPGSFSVADKNYQVDKVKIKLVEEIIAEKAPEQAQLSSNAIILEKMLASLNKDERLALLARYLQEGEDSHQETKGQSNTHSAGIELSDIALQENSDVQAEYKKIYSHQGRRPYSR